MQIRRRRLAVAAVVMGGLGLSGGWRQAAAERAVPPAELARLPIVPGRFLVRFAPGVDAAERTRLMARVGGRVVGELPALDVAIVAVADPLGAVRLLDADDEVLEAEPDYVVRILELPHPTETRQIFTPLVLVAADPHVGEQWHHVVMRTGEAWRYSRGEGAVIAVVDTGVDCGLADLADQCVAGFDFVNDDPEAGDDHGHGTDVAGLAAAGAHNGIGGVGVAPEARIMPLKAMAANGYGSHATIAAAIVWAADHGATVINLSLGGYYDSVTLRSAVQHAVDAGTVVIAAAGNDSIEMPTYPAAYAGVIGVAATDRTDGHWRPSNSGEFVDVAAPGAGVATSTLTGWGSSSGTSEATPLVAGVAALVASRHPDWTPAEVVARIQASSADLGPSGWDPLFGHGRVDAGRAVGP